MNECTPKAKGRLEMAEFTPQVDAQQISIHPGPDFQILTPQVYYNMYGTPPGLFAYNFKLYMRNLFMYTHAYTNVYVLYLNSQAHTDSAQQKFPYLVLWGIA